MKKIISALLAAILLFTPVLALGEVKSNDLQPMIDMLLTYTAQERDDLIFMVKGFFETDKGIDDLIERVKNATDNSGGLIDPYIMDMLKYTDRETLIDSINQARLAKTDIRIEYIGYLTQKPKAELQLSAENKAFMEQIYQDLYEEYPGLETLFTDDGITVGVGARFLKILYDINDGMPLVTDHPSDSNQFSLNKIADHLKDKGVYLDKIIKSFNETNQNNTDSFKKILLELGIYSPLSFYTVTFEGGSDATGTPPASLTYGAGAVFTLPANTFSKTGYDFNGWNDGNRTYPANRNYTMPNRNVTFTAIWTKKGSGGSPGGGGGGSIGGGTVEEPKEVISYTLATGEEYQSLGGSVLLVKMTKDGQEVPNAVFETPAVLSYSNTYQNPAVFEIGENQALTPVVYSFYENGNIKFLASKAGQYLIKDQPSNFSDVTGWGKPYVDALYARGVISGKAPGIFEPESNITREEFVKLMVSLLNLKNYNENTGFSDVAKDQWYYSYVMIGVTNGLIQGTGNGLFGTGQNITRQDISVIISKTLNSFVINISPSNKTVLDAAQIAEYAKESVMKLVHLGIVSGDQNGYFNPQNKATRQEAAKMLAGVLKLIVLSYE